MHYHKSTMTWTTPAHIKSMYIGKLEEIQWKRQASHNFKFIEGLNYYSRGLHLCMAKILNPSTSKTQDIPLSFEDNDYLQSHKRKGDNVKVAKILARKNPKHVLCYHTILWDDMDPHIILDHGNLAYAYQA